MKAIYKTLFAVSLKRFGQFSRMAEYDNRPDAEACIARNWPTGETKITEIRKGEFWISNGTKRCGVPNKRGGFDTGKPYLTFTTANAHATRYNARVARGKFTGEWAGVWNVCQYQGGNLVPVQ